MKQINEIHSVSAVLYHSDVCITANELQSTFKGVVVEVLNETGKSFEGTLVYFPGVTLTELKEVV